MWRVVTFILVLKLCHNFYACRGSSDIGILTKFCADLIIIIRSQIKWLTLSVFLQDQDDKPINQSRASGV